MSLNTPQARSFLRPELARETRVNLDLLIRRLADQSKFAERLQHPENREPIFGGHPWSPASLSHGFTGTATMYAVLARCDRSLSGHAHEHLSEAAKHLRWVKHGGLMGGPSGLLAAAQEAVTSPSDYRGLREALSHWVSNCQKSLLNEFDRSIGSGVPWIAYDFMNGVSGNARVLLDERNDEARDTVKSTVRYLCRMVLARDAGGRPGWWVPSALQPTDIDRETYPAGDLNVGVAHGVAGILSTLVAVAEKSECSSELAEAIDGATEWLDRWLIDADGYRYWPARVPADHDPSNARRTHLLTRAAWCYGTPGVALQVIRAASLLQQPGRAAAAVDALVGHMSQTDEELRLDGPTFCHGLAGALYIVYRAWQLTQAPALPSIGASLTHRLLQMAEPESPFLFRHWVPDSPDGWVTATSYKKLDSVGLLEGAAGVGLTLHAVSSEPGKPAQSWDRLFGLS